MERWILVIIVIIIYLYGLARYAYPKRKLRKWVLNMYSILVQLVVLANFSIELLRGFTGDFGFIIVTATCFLFIGFEIGFILSVNFKARS